MQSIILKKHVTAEIRQDATFSEWHHKRLMMFYSILSKLTKIALFILFSAITLHATQKIMPLGDSITWDWYYGDMRTDSHKHAYRNYLWYKLEDEGYDVEFVGSKNNGGAVMPAFDGSNEGYTGYTSYNIADIIYNRLERNTPDIILLHIGTNDLSSSIAGVEKILDEINRFKNNKNMHIKVILARIVMFPREYELVSQFNKNLDKMAERRIANGDDLVMVNMENISDLNVDGIHPNTTGYKKMAEVWFEALKKNLNPNAHRLLSDVNGDGKADIVGFKADGVYVSLSTGARFKHRSHWLADFGFNQGWQEKRDLRKMADVNGDGMADVVGFGSKGVSVALSNGSGFDKASLWLNDFGYNQGWRLDKGLRMMADVNGDGKTDIIAFGNNGVSVALSNGSDFSNARRWVDDFGYNQGWRNTKGLRMMADVNGDGKADIVAFGNNGVSVALSNGNSFVNASRWVDDFGYNQGWRNNKGLRYMSDVNGDGKADIVAFGNNGVSVALSNGNSFVNARRWVDDFGYNQGWRNDKGLRMMADVNDDGKADIVALGNNGVSVAVSNGSDFENASRWVENMGYNQGWRNKKHLRVVADVDGDGYSDIVGFGNSDVSVGTSTGADFSNTSSWLSDFGYNQGWKVYFTAYQEQQ